MQTVSTKCYPVSTTNTFAFDAAAGTVTRNGYDWEAQGFLKGQSVTISGIAGTWTVTRGRVEIHPFEELTVVAQEDLAAEAARLESFLAEP